MKSSTTDLMCHTGGNSLIASEARRTLLEPADTYQPSRNIVHQRRRWQTSLAHKVYPCQGQLVVKKLPGRKEKMKKPPVPLSLQSCYLYTANKLT